MQQDIASLQNYANMGANAAAGQASGALQTGQTIGQNTIGAGNAAAAGIVGSANAWSGGAQSALNSYLQYATMRNLFSNPSSGTPNNIPLSSAQPFGSGGVPDANSSPFGGGY